MVEVFVNIGIDSECILLIELDISSVKSGNSGYKEL